MPKSPLVSIVMANLNGKRILAESLPSLKKNTPMDKVEVFISDGMSTDGSREMVRKKFPWAKWLDNTLKGYGAAINYGFRKSRGKYLVLLVNDLYFLPGWLEKMVNIAESDPMVGAVGATMVDRSEDPSIYDGRPDKQKLTLCGACILIKREAWERVGEIDYDNFKPIYGEETDWCYRAIHYGYRMIESNSSRVVHWGSETQNSLLGKKRNTLLRYTNTYRAILANLTPLEFLQALPGQVLVFFNGSREGLASGYIRALLRNIRDYKYLLELRRKRREAERKGVPLKCINSAPAK